MNTKAKWNVGKLIVSAFLCVIFIAGGLVVQNISNDFIAVGNKPHAADDINGLFGAFGYFGSIFVLPQFVAACLFAILCIRYALKLRVLTTSPDNNTSRIIVPSEVNKSK